MGAGESGLLLSIDFRRRRSGLEDTEWLDADCRPLCELRLGRGGEGVKATAFRICVCVCVRACVYVCVCVKGLYEVARPE